VVLLLFVVEINCTMKKLLSIITFVFFIISISFVSALCQSSSGYYYDCDTGVYNHRYTGDSSKSSVSSYFKSYSSSSSSGYSSSYSYGNGYNYNTASYASTPIFKGSYGNYRYVKYASGDYNPPSYFVSYGAYGYPSFYGGYGYPYFGGGYGYSYPSFFSFFWY